MVRRAAAQARAERRRPPPRRAGRDRPGQRRRPRRTAPSTPRTPPPRAARPRPTPSAARPPPHRQAFDRQAAPGRRAGAAQAAPRRQAAAAAKPAAAQRPSPRSPASPTTPRPATRRARCSRRSTPARSSSCSSGTRTPPTIARPAAPCARSTCTAARSSPAPCRSPTSAATRPSRAASQVLESPTVLVIGAGGKARAITGYTQAKEIDQAVSDIGGKGFEARKAFQHTGFAKVADDACKDFGYALEQKSDPPTTVAGAVQGARRPARSEVGHSRNRLAKAKATTADERKLKAALVAFADKDIKWIADARSQLKAGAEPGDRLPHARAARERRQRRLRRRRQEAARPRLLRQRLIDATARPTLAGCPTSASRSTCATRSAAAACPRRMTARPAAPRAATSCASASPSTATAWPTPASRRRAAARRSPRAAPRSSSCAGAPRPRRRARRHARDRRRARRPEPRQAPRRRARRRRAAPRAGRARSAADAPRRHRRPSRTLVAMSGGVDTAVAALRSGPRRGRRDARAVARPRERRRALVLLGRRGARRARHRPRHGPPALHARPARRVPRRRRRAVAGRPRRRPDAQPVRALQRPRAPRRDARLRRPPRRRDAGHRPLRAPHARRACCAWPPTRPRTRPTCSPALSRATLARLRFPLGDLDQGPRSARIAAEHGLPVAAKPDSQDLCFLAGTGRAALPGPPRRPGRAPGRHRRRRRARRSGRHRGAHRFTVGQRRGLGVGGAPEPLYVLRTDARANTVTVGPRAALATTRRRACATCACTRRPPRSTPSSCATARRRCPARCAATTIELAEPVDGAAPGPDRGLPARRRRGGMRHNRCVTSDEIREPSWRFFEERDHLRLPAASLVPASYDPSVLLTTAGMHPLKPYFLGLEKPPHTALTTCQKCFRTTDIENVGNTTRHLTFFEMLGNFSIGDYFKQGAVEFALGAVARGLRLQPRGHLDHGLRGRRRARPRPRRGGDRGVGGDRRPARADRPAARARRTSGRPGRPARAGRAASSTSTAAWSGATRRRPARRRERALPGVLEPRLHAVRPGPDRDADAAAGQEHRHRPGPQPHGAHPAGRRRRSSRPTSSLPLMTLGRELATSEPDERALRILADHSRGDDVPHRRRRRALQRGPRLRPAPDHAPRDPAGPPHRHRARLPAAVRRASSSR